MVKRHVSQDVFDYNRKKLCNLYDSALEAEGQAYDIVEVFKLGDTPTLSFSLPYVVHAKKNFRWDFVKAEYLVRLTVDKKLDWFIVDQPDRQKDGKRIGTSVNCSHLSMQLKTKNIYMTFDDTNGIDNLPGLMEKVLRGTLWSFDEEHSDTFYENDDPDREKIRSLQSDGKEGAYQLITDICTLFDAYPVFDGESRTVACYSRNNKGPMRELFIGKNLNSLDVKYDSTSIVTRLYVEGTFDEDNYLTINSVNPTGLSYLQDFSYYKEIGLYTDEHEAATQKYYEDIKKADETLETAVGEAVEKEDELNGLWGQVKAIYFPIKDGALDNDNAVIINEADETDKTIGTGDIFVIEQSDHTYRDEKYPLTIRSSDICAVKFVTLPAGTIGARQVSVESKKQQLEGAIEDLDKEEKSEFKHDDKIAYYRDQIETLQKQIEEIYTGTTDAETGEHSEGLYELMWHAIQLALQLEDLYEDVAEASKQQDIIEATYAQAMGDMLREGYWNNEDYVTGQEQALYNDALEVMKVMCRPKVSYTFDYVSLAGQLGLTKDDLQLNMQMHVYDKELNVNDILHISQITRCYDDPSQDDVEVSNEDITLSGGSLDSVLGRMSQLADLIDQKNAIYKRASAISPNGSILTNRLEGQISILEHQLVSARSSWYTDDDGNMMFVSADGNSAMKICGEGYMIANGKKDDGTWNWRTFGTGEGFTADAITTGFLSADRIEAGSISAAKLNPNVGASINLSENGTIVALTQKIDSAAAQITISDVAPENPYEGQLWLDTSNAAHDVFRRWNGEAWVETTLNENEINGIQGQLTAHEASITQLGDEIQQRVSQTTYNTDMAAKADTGWVSQQIESVQTQTATEIQNSFTQATEYTDSSLAGLNAFKETVEVWQRFSADGMELGKSNSPFKTQLTNEKLSFKEDKEEVAYISNKSMYITQARVTNTLSVGEENTGWFDWTMISDGLGMKWKAV